jgi:HSP20 family protein
MAGVMTVRCIGGELLLRGRPRESLTPTTGPSARECGVVRRAEAARRRDTDTGVLPSIIIVPVLGPEVSPIQAKTRVAIPAAGQAARDSPAGDDRRRGVERGFQRPIPGLARPLFLCIPSPRVGKHATATTESTPDHESFGEMNMTTRTVFARPITGDFARMSREMDRLFETLAPALSGSPERRKGLGVPPVNLWQDEHNLYAEAELPGVTLENLEILAQGDSLSISGSRSASHDQGAKPLIRAERLSGAFERTLTLPVEIDADKVSATLRDGVLTITLPKAQAVLPRKITVNAG